MDEYTRECLSIDVERSITAEDVVSTLASLFRSRGEPAFIRSDNGPEFIAKTVKQWLEASEVETLYIEPGSPWENAYSETFISRFSDEPNVRLYLWDDEAVSEATIESLIAKSDRMFSKEKIGVFGVRTRRGEDLLGFCGFICLARNGTAVAPCFGGIA